MEFPVKWIAFIGNLHPIFLQGTTGPCPLLAIANTLSLRDELGKYLGNQANGPTISCAVLQSAILTIIEEKLKRQQDWTIEIREALYEQFMNVVMALPNGLNVDIHFDAPTSFVKAAGKDLFDFLDIRLLHGMLLDASQESLLKEIGGNSYDELVLKASASPNAYREALAWISGNNQLTYEGIFQLLEVTTEGTIDVLFWGNHFSVLINKGGVLFSLITDEWLANGPEAPIFESIADPSGTDVVFLSGDPFPSFADPTPLRPSGGKATPQHKTCCEIQ